MKCSDADTHMTTLCAALLISVCGMQASALSKLVAPMKRLVPLRMSLIKGLLKNRLQRRGALTPAASTSSAFSDAPALGVSAAKAPSSTLT